MRARMRFTFAGGSAKSESSEERHPLLSEDESDSSDVPAFSGSFPVSFASTSEAPRPGLTGTSQAFPLWPSNSCSSLNALGTTISCQVISRSIMHRGHTFPEKLRTGIVRVKISIGYLIYHLLEFCNRCTNKVSGVNCKGLVQTRRVPTKQ
jgi:hypothetical protein